jgi:hypothetical protein
MLALIMSRLKISAVKLASFGPRRTLHPVNNWVKAFMKAAMDYRVSQMSLPAYLFLLGKPLFFITLSSFCPFGLKNYCQLTKKYHVALLLESSTHVARGQNI